ncbi:hypothetical protein D9M68_914720 [compost metagenome]
MGELADLGLAVPQLLRVAGDQCIAFSDHCILRLDPGEQARHQLLKLGRTESFRMGGGVHAVKHAPRLATPP